MRWGMKLGAEGCAVKCHRSCNQSHNVGRHLHSSHHNVGKGHHSNSSEPCAHSGPDKRNGLGQG